MVPPSCATRGPTGCLRAWPTFGEPIGREIMASSDNESTRLDEAARAGWLYFIAGHTQDEIAKALKISRASAKRLVCLCLAERLITFRLEHPISACMELAARLRDQFHLARCEVVPTDPAAPLAATGIAERAATILEATLRTEKPTIVALGTRRALHTALASIALEVPGRGLTMGAAVGPAKVAAIRAALKGRLLNGLITDEATAGAILKR